MMYLQAALLEKQHSSLLSEQARLDAAVSISFKTLWFHYACVYRKTRGKNLKLLRERQLLGKVRAAVWCTGSNLRLL